MNYTFKRITADSMEPQDPGVDGKLKALGITSIVLACLALPVITYVSIKYKVNRNYSSMMLMIILFIESIDAIIFTICQLCMDKDYTIEYVNQIGAAYIYSFVSVLLLLQWHQCYQLLRDPDQAREGLIKNSVRRFHIVISIILLCAAAYSLWVGAKAGNSKYHTDHHEELFEKLNYTVYAMLISYRLTIVICYVLLYVSLLSYIKESEELEKLSPAESSELDIQNTHTFKKQVNWFFISAIVCTTILLIEIIIWSVADYKLLEISRERHSNLIFVASLLSLVANYSFFCIVIFLLTQNDVKEEESSMADPRQSIPVDLQERDDGKRTASRFGTVSDTQSSPRQLRDTRVTYVMETEDGTEQENMYYHERKLLQNRDKTDSRMSLQNTSERDEENESFYQPQPGNNTIVQSSVDGPEAEEREQVQYLIKHRPMKLQSDTTSNVNDFTVRNDQTLQFLGNSQRQSKLDQTAQRKSSLHGMALPLAAKRQIANNRLSTQSPLMESGKASAYNQEQGRLLRPNSQSLQSQEVFKARLLQERQKTLTMFKRKSRASGLQTLQTEPDSFDLVREEGESDME